jgi:hypothetical protein
MRKYAVWIEIGEGDSMYATMDNPFTYDSEPVIFDDRARAEDYAKLWKTGRVVEYFPTTPKSKVIKGDSNADE